jgi:hypothetical protein
MTINAPTTQVFGRTVVTSGGWLRKATFSGEDWQEALVIEDPKAFAAELRKKRIKADYFTFAQKIPDTKPHYPFHMEMDNVAAIPVFTYQNWLARLSTDARKDVKRATNRGVIVKSADFDDEFVRGIIEIHDEMPMRQGRQFKHYGKDFSTVQRDYSTYFERSEFIGAYYQDELIGMIKMLYVGELACMMQILSKTKHFDKRPTNALIAKAVEICESKGKTYLTFGRLHYGKKTRSSVVDFKRRNGFELIFYPRYFIPLNLKGFVALKLRLHRGLLGILPGFLISRALSVRSWLKGMKESRSSRAEMPEEPTRDDS